MHGTDTQPTRAREGPGERESGDADGRENQRLSDRAELQMRSFGRSRITCAQLCTVAMLDLEDAARTMKSSRDLQQRLYLYRRGRLEIQVLPYVTSGRAASKAWVLSGLIPVLIEAGGVEVIGLAFRRRPDDAGDLESVSLHVLDAEQHEGWTAALIGGAQAISCWTPESVDSLGEHAAREITGALRSMETEPPGRRRRARL
jgi:hypothetical protein